MALLPVGSKFKFKMAACRSFENFKCLRSGSPDPLHLWRYMSLLTLLGDCEDMWQGLVASRPMV